MGMVMETGASRRCHGDGDGEWGHPGGAMVMVMGSGDTQKVPWRW